MLVLGQLIPPLTARAADGRVVRAWDYKQKKSLAIVFLHAECPRCEEFMEKLAAQTQALAENDSVALVVFPVSTFPYAVDSVPGQVVVAADVTGRSQHSFLGEAAFSPAGQDAVGVFVADRYGELKAQWTAKDGDLLPRVEGILGWLAHIHVACEECGAPHWNV